MKRRNILITGARAPIALDLARSFEAAGWVPHLADVGCPWSARLARTTSGRLHRFSSPRREFETFVSDFKDLVGELDPELVIPTCEEVFYVAVAAERLGISDRVFAPSSDILRMLHSKVDFAAFARQCGLAAPETRRADSLDELQSWRPRVRELVFKPEFSRFGLEARIRPSIAAMDRLRPSRDRAWAVQDYVEGEELCLWSAAVQGELVAFAAYKPTWRLGRSSSFYFETDRDPKLLEIPRAVAWNTGMTGQLSFDVIRRPDGTIVPIECNPRGISGIHLFDGSGRLASAIMGSGNFEMPACDARHLAPAMWLMGAPQALVSGRWGCFRRDMARSRDVFPASEQPMATIGVLMDACVFAVQALGHGRSATEQTTSDIEWNGGQIG